jgi:hypothetical protein
MGGFYDLSADESRERYLMERVVVQKSEYQAAKIRLVHQSNKNISDLD